MASAGGKVYPEGVVPGKAVGTGELAMSRQPALDIPHDLDLSRSLAHYDVDEVHWANQQTELGTAPTVKEDAVLDSAYSKMLKEQTRFIMEHFKQKECVCFVPVPGQCRGGKECKVRALKCHCGEILSMHVGKCEQTKDQKCEKHIFVPREHESILKNPDEICKDDLPDTAFKWQANQCFNETTTSVFGKIDFNVEQIGGKKPAKYIRLCPEDSVDKCLELMQKYWHIMEPEPPNLVISVVGGAKNFKLDGRNRTIFSTGLIKAAKTTKAWLITSGFNMGVMKSVGQAVHEGQTFQLNKDRMSHVLRCIGIAPWGYVKDRHRLQNDGSENFTARYRSGTQIEHGRPVPLNPDHTHFIFVDDGYRSRYGGVAEFRSEFEKKISQAKEECGLGIPVVLILVEGGTDAIQDVNSSLRQGIPVVVCAGTGRAADILAYAFSHTSTTNSKQRVMSDANKEKLKNKIAQAYKKDGTELENLTKDVIRACQEEDLMTVFNMKKHEELDLAILSVLLKAETNSSREGQLKLAMTWNRADIAQVEIFREDAIWKKESLENSLTVALLEGKVEFVKLFLDNGIIMQEYLTTERLQSLYNSISKNSYLYQILKDHTNGKSEFTVKDVNSFLNTLLDRYSEGEVVGVQGKEKFKRPYKQLLIWAVLMDRWELAHLFLELGEEPITSALICTALCSGLESKMPRYLSVKRTTFQEMKDEFEKLAISVLDECHNTDPDRAIMLVERQSPAWSNMTCLQIAVSVSDQAFVSSVACQNTINNIWKNGIMSSWPKVFLCALCPLLVLHFVEISSSDTSKFQKIFRFYTAPLTKFSLYNAAYVCFLGLFTYMLSVDYEETPTATEWISIVWIFSFLIGKIHSFIVFPSPNMKGKWRDYFGILDKLDFLNLIFAVMAFIIRWSHVDDAKRIYCINAVIFYIIIMKFYTANRILGPKIYMINRMLRELANFVMVLVVFLLAYGVSSQGLLYQHRERSWQVLRDIVYFPYWQLFGEIFFDDIETDQVCTMALQTSKNGTVAGTENYCRTNHWLVPILLAVYLLIGNVLLMNLLVAIFSHVFETVEKNGIQIWKFQMYFLVMEFRNQPLLVPPLSLLFYLWQLFQWIYHRITCRKTHKAEQFTKRQVEYLSLFEKEMLANKLRPAKTNIFYSFDMKIDALQTRMDEIIKMIEDETLSSSFSHMSNKSKQETETRDLTQESKNNHKNKKKEKKRDRDTSNNSATEAPSEVNQFSVNALVNETVQDTDVVTFDSTNQASEGKKTESVTSPQPEDTVHLPPSRQLTSTFHLSSSQIGNTIENNKTAASDDLTSSRQTKNKSSRSVIQNLVSNKDLVLFEIYPPLPEPSSSPNKFPFRQVESADEDGYSDVSADSDGSEKHERTRWHLPHFGSDLQSRIERASHLHFSNKFSNVL